MTETAQTRPTRAPGRLGGRPVNRVGYGAMQLENTERERAVSLLRRAVELGVDHIDTAQFYGDGHVNEVIRAALHPYPDHLVVVSKVGAVHDEGSQYGLAPAQRPEDLRASVEANLRSLDVERLDVVNLRRLDGPGAGIRASGDQIVDLQDQLDELVALRREGKIGDIGLSNVTADQLRWALPAGIACVQNSYNVLDRSAEAVLDECREHDIAWVPFFPLGSALPGMTKVAEQPAVIAAGESAGKTPAQVGLAWLLARDPRVLLIPGTTDLAHLEQNLAVADFVLDAETTAELDALADDPSTERGHEKLDIGSIDFEAVYRGEPAFGGESLYRMPWDIGEPQPLLVQLERDGAIAGRVLDAGCGTGDNAIHLAERGYSVTGVDGSATAIDKATGRAAEHGVAADFRVADATRLDEFSQEFDTVLDSALYHCLPEQARTAYAAALHRVTKPGATLHLLCFADESPAAVSQDNLRTHLGQHWRITGIELFHYSAAVDEATAKHLFDRVSPGIADKLGTDEQGRRTFPMWHLRAERA